MNVLENEDQVLRHNWIDGWEGQFPAELLGRSLALTNGMPHSTIDRALVVDFWLLNGALGQI